MTIEELQHIINDTQWDFIGKGSYNSVSVSKENLTINGYSGRWVLKIPKCSDYISMSNRAVRKWNDLNPNYPALITKNGWIAPYIGNTPASDRQIANKLIDIYRRTRNIVGDAGAAGNNFLVHNGEVICVDVDHAFRRGSFATDLFEAATNPGYHNFLNKCLKNGYEKTVNVIKTLFYLEKNISNGDIHDKYLTTNVITKLHAYRYQNKAITVDILNTILDIVTIDPESDILITPLFVSTLQALPHYQHRITKGLLQRINNQLKPAQLTGYIQSGCLDFIKVVIKHNNALIEQVDNEGFTPLLIAAMYGQTKIVSYLLTVNACIDRTTPIDPNCVTSNMTAVDIAIHYGNDSTARLLIDHGTKLNYSTYMIYAAKNNLIEDVKLCISRNPRSLHAKDNFNQTALLWAALRGYHDIVEYLISQGADVNIPTKLPGNHNDYLRADNCSPLDWAIKGGHTATILALFEARATTNHIHTTINNKPLWRLIFDNDVDLIQVLLHKNPALLNHIDQYGYTPLQYAALFGNVNIVAYLFKKGADLNAVTPTRDRIKNIRHPNMTAMDILLSIQKHDMIAILLIDLGANVSPGVNGNYHAIHLAAKNGRGDIVKQLVAREPILIHLNDHNNQTPLLCAAYRGHVHIMKYLIDLGAGLERQRPATNLVQLSVFQPAAAINNGDGIISTEEVANCQIS